MALFHFVLSQALDTTLAAAASALGILWAATGLMLVSGRLDRGPPILQVAAVMYGIALAAFIASVGVVVLRSL